MPSRSAPSFAFTWEMSVRYLSVSSVDDGATGVPETSLSMASRISWVPAITKLAMCFFAPKTLPEASSIHAEMVL